MSKYNEEEEKWDVKSFSLKEKSLALPTMMKMGNPNSNNFAGNRYQKRSSNKQVIFQNYDNNEIEENINEELNNENIDKNININLLPNPRNNSKRVSNRRPKDISVNNSGSFTNIQDSNEKTNNRIGLRISNEKIILDGRRKSKSHVPALRNSIVTQKIVFNQPNEDERNKINKILMNQKEREKFESLANRRNSKAINPLYGSSSNPMQLLNKLGNNKYGKIQLNPLGSNNLNNYNNMNNMNLPPPLVGNKKYKLAKI